MRALKLFACVCLVAGGLAVAAGDALASQSPAVDCNSHGYKLTQHYTIPELRNALATMPASIKEYTPCYQVISDQLARQVQHVTGTNPTGSSGSSSSFLSGPLIAIVIVIVAAGGGAAYLASRRRTDAEEGEPEGEQEPGGGDDQPPPTTGP